MSGRVIKAGSTDQYCEVKVWTTADGVPNTTLVYNTAALAIWYQIGNAAAVEVVVGGSPAPASMSAGGAHADWGIYHIAQGRYKIGLADAVVSAAANVTVWIVFTDCDSAPCEIDVVGYDKTAIAVGANTVEPATPTNVTDARDTITALLPAALVGGRMDVSVGANLDKTGYSLSQSFPANFATLAINASGHVSRVTLVDTTTTNSDMVSITGLASQASVDMIDSIVDTILLDTNELQTNQGDWVTATGFSTHSAADVWAVATRALTDKADFEVSAASVTAIQSGLATANVLAAAASSAASADTFAEEAAEWGNLIYIERLNDERLALIDGAMQAGADGDTGKTLSDQIDAIDGGPSAEDIRIEMDANSMKLADILGDTNELQTNQGNWATATSVTVSDKTGFSIAGTINTLDALDAAQDVQHNITQLILNSGIHVTSVSSGAVQDIFSTYAIEESYASSGVDGTPAQVLYLTQQAFTDFAITGTTISIKGLDGSEIATYVLDSSSAPTSRTRAT